MRKNKYFFRTESAYLRLCLLLLDFLLPLLAGFAACLVCLVRLLAPPAKAPDL